MIEIPADYKFIIVSVGDDQHPVTMQQIDDYRDYVETRAKEGRAVIGLPHFVKLTVMK